MPYYTFRLVVDDKGRLKLPAEVQEALGEKRDVVIVSEARQTVRIYPFGGAISRRIVIGRRPASTDKVRPTWDRLVLVPNGINLLLNLETCISGFATTIDACGRVVVAPHQAGHRSEVELENEEVYLEWRRDHFFVSKTNPRSSAELHFC